MERAYISPNLPEYRKLLELVRDDPTFDTPAREFAKARLALMDATEGQYRRAHNALCALLAEASRTENGVTPCVN
jgi:hypothetical protein